MLAEFVAVVAPTRADRCEALAELADAEGARTSLLPFVLKADAAAAVDRSCFVGARPAQTSNGAPDDIEISLYGNH